MRYGKIFLLYLLVISLKGNAQNNKPHFLAKGDSLLLNVSQCDSMYLINQYYKWNNFTIPRYYIIKDSLKINVNDSVASVILILSPRFQEYEVSEINCDENINNRLLLFFIKKKSCYELVAINSSAIPNVQDYPSEPFLGITGDAKKITLKFFTGTSRKCRYEFIFKTNKNKFILEKSISHCYLIDLSKQKDRIKVYKSSPKNNLQNINLKKYLLDLNNNMGL